MASETLRTFIPFGYCVPGDPTIPSIVSGKPLHEVFQAIDSGRGNESLVAVAERACLSCIQIDHCREQRAEIGNALWRTGVPMTVAGAERIAFDSEPERVGDMDTTAFRFDLSVVSTEPGEYLKFIRQGIRAKQLHITSRPPVNARVIAGEYEDMLTQRNFQTADALATQLSDQERDRAFRYIVVSICQQADFRRLSSEYRSTRPGIYNRRYNPDTHDYETYYAAVELYMQETLAIKRMAYQNPGQMAIHFSAEFSRRLLDRFGPAFTLQSKMKPVAKFYEIIRGNIRDPEGALTAFLAREQSHRANGAGAPAWITRQRALRKRPYADDPSEREKREQLLAAHGHLGAVAVDKAIVQHNDPEGWLETVEARIADLVEIYGTKHKLVTASVMQYYAGGEDYKTAVAAYMDRIKDLDRLYGKDPDLTDANVRWLARQYAENSLDAAVAYKKRLKRYRGWAAAATKSYDVPDSYLRQRALQGEVNSYDDIAKAYIVKLLKARIHNRNKQRTDGNLIQVENWTFNRLTSLYAADEIEEVGESLIHFIDQGILTSGIAELSDLQDPLIYLDVESMADPGTRRYLTFAEGLASLTSRQRFALIHEYNLTRFLYGRPFTSRQVEAFLGPNRLGGYGKKQVKPLCVRLVDGVKGAPPVPFSLIQHDVVDIMRADDRAGTREEVKKGGLSEDLMVVIGADVIQLTQASSQEEHVAALLTDDQSRWLQRQINTYCPPLEQAQHKQDIAEAVRSGRVIIDGGPSAPYRLSLAKDFYHASLDQVDRAVIAHVMGVDNLLYGKNLNLTLRYRLGTGDLTAYLLTTILPKIAAWRNIGAALSEVRATPTAFKRLIDPIETSQLWHARGRLIAVSAQLISHLRQKAYPERPTSAWTSNYDLSRLAAQRQKNLGEVIQRLGIGLAEGAVYKLHGADKLEVFYSPCASEEIRQQLEA